MPFLELIMRFLAFFLSAICTFVSACSGAGEATQPAAPTLRVAVATNFMPAMEGLQRQFEDAFDVEVELVSGATGALYTQIVQGAPYDVFLAADQDRPEKLEAEGFAVAGTRATYAIGRLALWRPGADEYTTPGATFLGTGKVAIANPRLAPYGQAASDVIASLKADQALQGLSLIHI